MFCAASLTIAGHVASAPIPWQTVQVSTMGPTGFSVVFSTLLDGRFVLGQQGKLYVQNAFGNAAKTEFATNGVTFDPSFVAVQNGTRGLLGAGGSFGAISGLHPFNPTVATGSTGGVRPALATTLQSYVGAYWKSGALEGWLIGGANGPSGPFSGHNVVFVSLDGTKKGAITEELCTYSAGLATDANGNLYAALYELDGSPKAANADKVMKLTAAQLTPKIQSILSGTTPTPLALADATLVHKFTSASSIAVDGQGRIWAAGFREPLVEVYDPTTDIVRQLVPTHGPINGWGPDTYQVSTFTRNGVSEVAVLAYDSYTAEGSPVYFAHVPLDEVKTTETTYHDWLVEQFGVNALTPETEASLWGQDADPDQDGLTNLEEYALDTLPQSSDGSSVISKVYQSDLLSLSFRRHPLRTDVIYTVEVSSLLTPGTWTAIASSTGGLPTVPSTASAVSEVTEGALKRVKVTDEASAAGETRRFMRLTIALAPP